MAEFPPPIRLPGQPPLPREPTEPAERRSPAVVDESVDAFGAEDAAAHLSLLVQRVPPTAGRPGGDGLWPPIEAQRDRVHGPAWAPATLMVFGAFGAPSSRPLAQLLAHVRDRHAGTTRVAWRHFPDPDAHPRAAMLALAAEAAAAQGRFWAATRELLKLRHQDPGDVRSALLRADLDPDVTIAIMRAGSGTDRIVEDVASARASGVMFAPTLFIGGERYRGELKPAALSAALGAGDPP
jgi:NhaA family Na+:H+ antiporter